MDNWFKSRWFVRGVSLVFAVLLYVFVQVEIDKYDSNESRIFPSGNEEVATIENMPVNIRIDQEKYVVGGVPQTVSVTLEGSESTLKATARQKNFDIYVNLEGLDEGTHTVELKHANVPRELKVYIEPKTVEVTIEERASKQFTVTTDFINTDKLPQGYELGQSTVEPSTVTITSSKEIIDQIAIVKVFVDVAGLKEPIDNREVPVNVYDARGNELNVQMEPESVAVSVDVHNPSKSVPVSVSTTGELPEGYTMSSVSANVDKVKLYGTSDVLKGIEEVPTEDIDLSDLNESGTVEVGLALPDGVHVKNSKKVEVKVELEQKKTLEDVPIEVENLQDGQEVSFVQPESQSMEVTVSGKQKDVSATSAEDIAATVDASGLEEGEHVLPVSLEGPENVDLTGEYKQVTIEIT
ncbi:CdaR family protein [Virgibacillus siamensis]|uniref:CdaR family protein n=1 Tax=Virgibacillus siamensis TaxID=480071 RepID=UPI00098452E2|nr:CdaR family protein [Virgibacillus siamensis]